MRRGESSKMRTCARQAGVCRLSFACASLQPFDESSGSGKLEPQAEEIDLSLQAQLEVAAKARKAVRAERLPVVSFDGYYGVLGEIGSLYHGVFTATGKVSVPVFQEGQLRGEREVADAQVIALRQQIESLRITIEQQIRSAMLDVQSSNDLVKVAKSNVDLATQELQDATDRFSAGVDDNLPVVQAQATLAAAQSRLVDTLYQYNQSKLQLARNTGVVESQYKVYLGR